MPDQPAVSWGVRQGGMAVCLILAVALLAVVAGLRLAEPTPAVFNAESQQQYVQSQLEIIPPAAAWLMLLDTYEPLAENGFVEMFDPQADKIDAVIARSRNFQMVALVTGLLCLAGALITRFWPSSPGQTSGG